MARARIRANQIIDTDLLTEDEHDALVHENLVTSGTLNFQDGTISGTGDVYATTFYGDGSNITGIPAGEPDSLYYDGTKTAETTSEGISVPGGGVKFPATQVPSSDPNTLDDYEEGSGSDLQFADASSGGNVSSTAGTYTYIKIGRAVTIDFEFTNINTTGLTPSNQSFIRNFPFSFAVQQYFAAWTQQVTFSEGVFLETGSAVTRAELRDVRSGQTDAAISVSDVLDGSAEIRGTFTYISV